jgi:hypothetical protein
MELEEAKRAARLAEAREDRERARVGMTSTRYVVR